MLFAPRLFLFLHCGILFNLLFQLALSQPLGKAHFFIQEGSSKCFLEDAREGVPITVSYHSLDNPGVPCAVVVKGPNGRPVASRPVNDKAPHGRLTYLAKSAGEHSICVTCQSAQWFASSQLKWSLSVDLSDFAVDVANIAKSSDMGAVKEMLNGALHLTGQIEADLAYGRIHEEQFRSEIVKLNNRVVFCAIIQVIVMSATAAVVVWRLGIFFRTSKLW